MRLTIAPLDYGSGVKGKVIESLSAGVPCVCTPIAAEGLDLPPALRACVVQGTEAIAGMVLRLHSDEAANDECRRAGLEFVEATLSEAELDATMRRILGLPAAPATLPGEALSQAPAPEQPAPESPPSELPAAEPPGLRLKVTRKKRLAVSPPSAHPREETPSDRPPADEPVKASRKSKRSKGHAPAPSTPPARNRGVKPGKSGVKPAKKR